MRRSAAIAILACVGFFVSSFYAATAGASDATSAKLEFYLVYPKAGVGRKLVDTPAGGKLGYVNATPDLIVGRLLSVELTNQVRKLVVVNDQGEEEIQASAKDPCLDITFEQVGIKRIQELVFSAKRKPILMMCEGETLATLKLGDSELPRTLRLTSEPGLAARLYVRLQSLIVRSVADPAAIDTTK